MTTANVTRTAGAKGTTGGRPIIRSAIAMTILVVANPARGEGTLVEVTMVQEEATTIATGGMIHRQTTCSGNIHPTWGVLPRMKVTSLEGLVAGALTRRTSSMETPL